MKGFIWFFLLVFFFYGLINYYLIRRSRLLFFRRKTPAALTIVWILLSLCYPASRFIKQVSPSLAQWISLAGSVYLGLMIYLALTAFFTEGVFALMRIFRGTLRHYASSFLWQRRAARTAAALSLLIFTAGWMQFYSVQVTRFQTALPGKGKLFKVAVISDLHYGNPFITDAYVQKVFETAMSQNPHAILLPGDLIDSPLSTAEKENLSRLLSALKAPEGVFAVPGNHEYYAGLKESLAVFQKGGLRVLMDEGMELDSVFLAGRQDREAFRFGTERKALKDILKSSAGKPALVMDHQPRDLEEAAASGAALQVSGHTHHGQMFPIHLITQKVYEVSKGFLQKGQTRFFVSSGAGGWGPPIRFLNPPEVMVIEIEFEP